MNDRRYTATITEQASWTARREYITTQIMAGFAAGPAGLSGIKGVAAPAIEWADALMAELAKEGTR